MQQIIDAVSAGSLYSLIALGIALVFGIMRLVNFAHGELLMVGGYTILVVSGLPWPLVAIITLVIVAGLAAAMERLAFRPLRAADPSTLLVSSFAISILLQNVVVAVAGVRAKSVEFGAALNSPVTFSGLRVPIIDFVTIGTTIVLIVGLGAFLKRTSLGIEMRAAAENFTMTRLLGVPANRVIAGAFAVSGLFAGAGALLLTATTGVLTPTLGLQPVLIAFVATVIGGMGSLLGAAVGGFVLGAVGVALQTALPVSAQGYRDAFLFGIVILILTVRPDGLFATGALKERV